MSYIIFYNRLRHFPVFSTQDIKKAFPAFDTRRLVEWQQKGYIQKIINRWYRFTEQAVDESYLWYVANRIYQPSYISMESALSYYGLIPEAVYTITAISSLKTKNFETSLGIFDYRHLKPALLFGYRLVAWKDFRICMAEPEKLLLDYFYLRPALASTADFEALRINPALLSQLLDREKLNRYLSLFNQKTLYQRTHTFLKLLDHAELH